MSDAHQYLSALSAEQKAEEVRRELARLQAEMAAMNAPIKEQIKTLKDQLKTLTPAAHVHGPDCGAACTPLETKSLPPEDETKFGDPVPLRSRGRRGRSRAVERALARGSGVGAEIGETPTQDLGAASTQFPR